MFEQGELIEEELRNYDLQEELEDLIVSIYGLTKTRFDMELFDRIAKMLKAQCDYSMMNTGLACLYSSLLIVSYENPAAKIREFVETIEMVRGGGFRSRVSNLIGFVLLDQKDIENQVIKALKIYHIMHDYHGVITGEDDYLSTVYLASSDRKSTVIVAEIEEDYKRLANLSFKKGNALQSLVHLLQLCDVPSRDRLLELVDDLHKGFRAHKIKTNGSQILIYGLAAGLNLDKDLFISKVSDSIQAQLEKKKLRRLRSLHKTAIILEVINEMYTELNQKSDNDEEFIKASIMLMLTAYLYRERLV